MRLERALADGEGLVNLIAQRRKRKNRDSPSAGMETRFWPLLTTTDPPAGIQIAFEPSEFAATSVKPDEFVGQARMTVLGAGQQASTGNGSRAELDAPLSP